MVKIKSIFIVTISCIVVWVPGIFGLYAQQEPHFTQYMFNRLSYNPGYAGSNGAMCITGFFREQWMGLKLMDNGQISSASKGETMNISFDMPVKLLHGGIGATVIKDKIGYYDNTYVKLDYAYRFQLPTGNLAIGIEAQLFNASFDNSHLVGSSQFGEDDKPKPNTDPVLNNLDKEDMLFDLQLGVYYQVPGKVYLGAAVSKIMETKSEKLKWNNRRFYYVLAGYEWIIPDYPSWRMLPSALLKTDFTSSSAYQVDASLLAEYEHKIWGGMSYRIDDAVMVLGGFTIKDFKVGFSYDIPTSRVSTQGSGSFEVFLRWCFNIETSPKVPTSYKNTIYM
ncbi:MAG: PorP/SprF family type IX secretion system membrane protein [Bacteroidales bacterium]